MVSKEGDTSPTLVKVNVSNLDTYVILIRHLYLSSVRLGVDLRTDTKKTCLKEIRLGAQNLLAILGRRVNVTGG